MLWSRHGLTAAHCTGSGPSGLGKRADPGQTVGYLRLIGEAVRWLGVSGATLGAITGENQHCFRRVEGLQTHRGAYETAQRGSAVLSFTAAAIHPR